MSRFGVATLGHALTPRSQRRFGRAALAFESVYLTLAAPVAASISVRMRPPYPKAARVLPPSFSASSCSTLSAIHIQSAEALPEGAEILGRAAGGQRCFSCGKAGDVRLIRRLGVPPLGRTYAPPGASPGSKPELVLLKHRLRLALIGEGIMAAPPLAADRKRSL